GRAFGRSGRSLSFDVRQPLARRLRNLKLGARAEITITQATLCARIEWFWRAGNIGQSHVEVPDLRRLTDAAERGILNHRQTSVPERLGAVALQRPAQEPLCLSNGLTEELLLVCFVPAPNPCASED